MGRPSPLWVTLCPRQGEVEMRPNKQSREHGCTYFSLLFVVMVSPAVLGSCSCHCLRAVDYNLELWTELPHSTLSRCLTEYFVTAIEMKVWKLALIGPLAWESSLLVLSFFFTHWSSHVFCSYFPQTGASPPSGKREAHRTDPEDPETLQSSEKPPLRFSKH